MKHINSGIFILIILLFGYSIQAPAAEYFNPVIVYQQDIKSNSFNHNIHKGVQRFTENTGIPCKEIIVEDILLDYMSKLDEVAQQGYSPIFLIYGNHLEQLSSYVRKYPNTRFLVLGQIADEPNMFSFDFAEHEGSFLAGALAALTSQSETIAFVSVSDLPLMRRFWCGYVQGANYINPDITILTGFIGDYPHAWFDGKATATMANDFMDQGADVIYQAAGGAGPAVLEAAAKRGKLGIGIDQNQNGLYPGHVLTSMLKQTDRVVYAALIHAKRGIWRDNIKTFGLAQDAVGLAFDEHNSSLISPETRQQLDEIRSKILIDEILIHDYVTDNQCPL